MVSVMLWRNETSGQVAASDIQEDVYIPGFEVKCFRFMKDTEVITVCETYEELYEISGIVLVPVDIIKCSLKKVSTGNSNDSEYN